MKTSNKVIISFIAFTVLFALSQFFMSYLLCDNSILVGLVPNSLFVGIAYLCIFFLYSRMKQMFTTLLSIAILVFLIGVIMIFSQKTIDSFTQLSIVWIIRIIYCIVMAIIADRQAEVVRALKIRNWIQGLIDNRVFYK